jgi:hypothetical protein
VDHVVELSEDEVAFEDVLVVAAIIEALQLESHDHDSVVEQFETTASPCSEANRALVTARFSDSKSTRYLFSGLADD